MPVRWPVLLIAVVLTPGLVIGRWWLHTGQDRTPVDFMQYYVGGLMVRTGHPEALYPQPIPGSTFNAGFQNGSTLRPAAVDAAAQRGIQDIWPRFIQPPPSALFFAPLSLLRPGAAIVCWLCILSACQIGSALIAAALCRRCRGSARAANLVFLAVALAPAGLQALQFGNLSPVSGLLVGLNLLFLLRGQQVAAGVVFVIGLVIKYWNIALMPVHMARGQFRAAWVALLTGAALLLLSVAVLGTRPFHIYVTEIAPTLSRPYHRHNHSLMGLALRLNGRRPLTPGMRAAFEMARWSMFFAVAWLTWSGRRAIANSDAAAIGIAASWLAWIFLFSPLFWGHYAAVLMPLWGWLAAVASRRGGWERALALFAIAATSFFTPMLQGKLRPFPDPWFMHQSAALLVMMFLAVREVYYRDSTNPADQRIASAA